MAEHAHHIEGEWKNFVFKLATKEDHPKILAALRKTYYREEPTCKLFGYTEERADEIDKLVKAYLNLNENLSFYVEDKLTGKIAGVRVTNGKYLGKPEPTYEINLPEIKNMFKYWFHVCDKVNVWEKYAINQYAFFLMTCVDPEFQGQGLVTEMYRRSINYLRARGFPLCVGLFTSPFTRKAVAHFPFEDLASEKLADFKGENGLPLIPSGDPEQFANTKAMRLL